MTARSDQAVLSCPSSPGEVDAEKVLHALMSERQAGRAIWNDKCASGCGDPNTARFQAHERAQYLLEQIETDGDVAVFAVQYQRLEDGWTNVTEWPGSLFRKVPAHLPAVVYGGWK